MLDKLSKNQKIALAVGAVLILYLIYRWQTSSTAAGQASGTSTGTDTTQTPDQSAADYASLAGQEQSDVAALQQQNQQLLAQEQSDISGLQSSLSGIGGGGGTTGAGVDTTGTDATTAAIDALTSQIDTLTSQLAAPAAGAQAATPSIAAGQTKINRTGTVAVKSGSPFARYYRTVTGKNPPARVQSSNFVYQAFKAGIKATALAPRAPTPHPSSKNTKVAHPNPTHKQQSNVTHRLPRPRPKPPAHRHAPPARRK